MKHPTLAAVLLTLAGCTTAAPPAPPAAPEAAPEASPAAHAADHGAIHEGAHESAPQDHMAHMEQVRSALKGKLGQTYDEAPPGLAEADAVAGAQTYERLCSTCHGASGKGDGPAAAALARAPSDHTDGHHARYYSDAGRLEVIRNGIEGTPMVGFGALLSAAELLGLYAHVTSLRSGSPTPASGGKNGEHGAHDHGAHGH